MTHTKGSQHKVDRDGLEHVRVFRRRWEEYAVGTVAGKVILRTSDGNVTDYDYRLTPKLARELGQALIDASDETVVGEVLGS